MPDHLPDHTHLPDHVALNTTSVVSRWHTQPPHKESNQCALVGAKIHFLLSCDGNDHGHVRVDVQSY
jgi:hypothetical protein